MQAFAGKLRTLTSQWTWWHALLFFGLAYTLFVLSYPVGENDIYWHLRMGQDIWEYHRLTGNPDWTFGPYIPGWETTQSGSELFFYLLYKTFGWNGILLYRIISGLTIIALTCYTSYKFIPKVYWRNFGVRTLSVTVVFGLAGVILAIQERPQAFSYIFLPILGVVLYRILYTGKYPNAGIIFLWVALWTCLHGVSTLVAPLIFLFWALRATAKKTGHPLPIYDTNPNFLRSPIIVITAAFLGTLANPLGWRIYERAYAIQQASIDTLAEWGKPAVSSPLFVSLMLLLITWVISIIILTKKGFPLRGLTVEGASFIILLIWASTAIRMIPIIIFLIIPIVSRRLAQAWTKPTNGWDRKNMNLVNGFVIITWSIVLPFVFLHGFNSKPVPEETPVRILSGLHTTEGQRNYFVDYNLSGKVQLFSKTGDKTNWDGRSDRYGAELIKQQTDIYHTQQGWEDKFSAYSEATDAIIPAEVSLVETLQEKGWTVACEEGEWVWLTRLNMQGECPTVQKPLVSVLD